jgi:hypothetical protein
MTSKDSRPRGGAPSASSGQAPRGRATPPRVFSSKLVPILTSYFLTPSTLAGTIESKIPSQGGTMCPFFAFGGLDDAEQLVFQRVGDGFGAGGSGRAGRLTD